MRDATTKKPATEASLGDGIDNRQMRNKAKTQPSPETKQPLAVREGKPSAPAPIDSRGAVHFTTMDDLARFCRMVVNSGLAPRGFSNPESVAVAIQAGAELGLGPVQSLQNIAVINSRPVLWGDAALALAMGHPAFVDISETHDDATNTATCTVKRQGRSDVTRTFSEKDAKLAGLWGKSGPWTTYPRRMLQMRARAFALRDAFPDALKGVGIGEEVADYKPLRRANVRAVAEDIELPQRAINDTTKLTSECDDRCIDEQRESDIAERNESACMRDYGMPFDPYADND